MFEGCHVATITPFKEGTVDLDAFGDHIESLLAGGVAGIVPCGTTGESPALSADERKQVIRFTVEKVAGRAKVIAGTGTNNTEASVAMTRFASEAGADAALVITPYYSKPTQAGLVAHFEKIADASSVPLILYNVPGRTGVNLLPETMIRLARHPRIAGVKEASGGVDQTSAILAGCRTEVLSGDDSLTLPILSVGGVGVISVVANLVPAAMVRLIDAYASGDTAAARSVHLDLYPLSSAMFIETNPVPVKTAMRLLGRANGELRLPMVPMAAASIEKLEKVMAACPLLARS